MTMTPRQHANNVRDLPPETFEFVFDALRVRAMDFVCDRLTDGAGDDCADIVRELVGGETPEREHLLFTPDQYVADPDAYKGV